MDDQLRGRLARDLSTKQFIELFDAGELDLTTAPHVSLAVPPANVADPRSSEYAQAVLQQWQALSGRASYAAEVDEIFELDPLEFFARPYPFSSNDPEEIGRYLCAVGWFIGCARPSTGSRVAELGAGWGHLAIALTQTGCDVTAVDVNPSSIHLLRRRSAALDTPLRVVQSTYLDYADQDLDLIVFFESFHHCADPLALLDRCFEMLSPSGRLAFLAEPVFDDFYCSWGVRLDGPAAFMTRHAGWLELGFNRSFLYRELNARGFSIAEHRLPSIGDYGTLEIATKTPDGCTAEGKIAPDEESTWDARGAMLAPARLATRQSSMTLTEQTRFASAVISLVNLCDEELSVSVGVNGADERLCCAPQERRQVVVALPTGRRLLAVESTLSRSTALSLDAVGVCVESVSFE